MYLSLGISISLSTFSEVICDKFLDTFVILFTVSLPIKSPVASVVLGIGFLKAVLIVSVADYLVWSNQDVFGCIYCLRFYLFFLPIFLAKSKNP